MFLIPGKAKIRAIFILASQVACPFFASRASRSPCGVKCHLPPLTGADDYGGTTHIALSDVAFSVPSTGHSPLTCHRCPSSYSTAEAPRIEQQFPFSSQFGICSRTDSINAGAVSLGIPVNDNIMPYRPKFTISIASNMSHNTGDIKLRNHALD